jgi:hypothetical protein
MKKLTVVFVLVVLLLAVPAGVTHAAPNFDQVIADGETVNEDLVIWGGSLIVEEGGTVDGDVSVFGGTAVLDGHVKGDVVIFGGTASLSGEVDGDLVLFGGTLTADSNADVDGDCLLIGGSIAGDSADSINCSAVGDFPAFAIPSIVQSETPSDAPERPAAPSVPSAPRVSGGRSFFGTISAAAGQSLLFGILALAAAVILPNHMGQVTRTLKDIPGRWRRS